MVTLFTGIMFLLHTCMHFLCSEIYEGGPHVSLPPMKWSAIAESLRKIAPIRDICDDWRPAPIGLMLG